MLELEGYNPIFEGAESEGSASGEQIQDFSENLIIGESFSGLSTSESVEELRRNVEEFDTWLNGGSSESFE